ncbi:YycH family regulatory protein [Furfurilactobacillus milii]|nr:two-component system activity regulator YycH [Furfurilactobacillus milii]
MWTRLRNGLLPVALTLLIGLGIVLSLLIWINPARFDRARTATSSTRSTHSTVSTRSIDDIYLPTQVIVTDSHGHAESIYNPKINLVTTVKNEVKNWRMTNFRKVSQKDKDAYQKLLNQKNTVQLSYADNIGRSIFNSSYDQRLLMSPTAKFSRILFSTTKPGELYLLNDNDLTIYKISVSKQQLSKVRRVIAEGDKRYPVEQITSKDHTLTYYTNEVHIPKYSYLIGEQSANFFVTSLLNSGEATSVSVQRHDGHTIYFDGAYKRMTVNDKTGAVMFENYNAKNSISRDLGRNLKTSFAGLSSTGMPLDSVRYFDNENNGREVTYRSFVEGFPIFNQTDFGAVQVKNKKSGTEEIDFTLTNLQVPLPTDSNSNVTLPATSTVMAQLEAAGISKNKIKDIVLGYQWENNYDSKQVVDLQPTYYVYTSGKWQLYTDLLNGGGTQ